MMDDILGAHIYDISLYEHIYHIPQILRLKKKNWIYGEYLSPLAKGDFGLSPMDFTTDT
jgi:hypothetical protein